MRAIRRGWNRLLGSLTGRHPDRDLAEELDSHIQLMAEENIRRGVAPDEAWRLARVRFGSVESAKESYRDQRGLPALDSFLQDLRFALRGVRRNPGFATVAVASLAIGIGANTAIFSLVNGVLLRPLALQDPERIYAVREVYPRLMGQRNIAVNPVHALAWGSDCPSIELAAAMRANSADLASGGDPVSIPGLDVPHQLFALLGVQPILGRAFLPEEEREGNHLVAILSESLWRSRFQADPALVGRTIQVDGQPYRVAGIMPASFRPPFGIENVSSVRFEIFRPLVLSRQEASRMMGNHNYAAVVRLKPGAAPQQALAEINVVQARFPKMAGRDDELRATLVSAHELVTGRSRGGLWMLAAAVGAVLLIVCVNLANLLLSRVASRSRESAIRTALGAGRARQFRMALTESLLLAVAGGVLGVLLATWLVQLLPAATALNLPRIEEVRLDGTVLAFAAAISAATALIFGALPAWRMSRADPQAALRSGSHTVTESRRGMRLRETLIGIEVGLSAALLIAAGLLTASLSRLINVDKGFDSGRVLTVDLSLSGGLYAEPAARERFFERLLTEAARIPGVVAASLSTELPVRGDTWNDPIYLEGGRKHTVNNRYTSPGYFDVMKIALLRGRAYDGRDRGQSVAVLSEKAAQILWPGDPNPVGRRFMGEDDKIKTLVGAAADVRATLQNDPPPTAYYPYWQRVPGGGALAIRTAGDPYAASGALRAAIRAGDPQVPLREIRTMEQIIDGTLAQRKFLSTLVAVFASSALLVAGLGIYGVVSFSVARRRNEIGIRLALGAQRSGLLALVVRQGMIPVALGLAGGVAAALLFGSAIRGLLYGIEPGDPATVAAVIVVLLAVGAGACLIPARRAASADAVSSLRSE